jgi:hypothetical protein
MMRATMQARISQTAVSWLFTLARNRETYISELNNLEGGDLIREIALFRWGIIVQLANDARRAESKERVKKLDELYYGERDAKLAWHLVKLMDEGDKEMAERVKERKQEERARKRESWQKGRRK